DIEGPRDDIIAARKNELPVAALHCMAQRRGVVRLAIAASPEITHSGHEHLLLIVGNEHERGAMLSRTLPGTECHAEPPRKDAVLARFACFRRGCSGSPLLANPWRKHGTHNRCLLGTNVADRHSVSGQN